MMKSTDHNNEQNQSSSAYDSLADLDHASIQEILQKFQSKMDVVTTQSSQKQAASNQVEQDKEWSDYDEDINEYETD